MRGWELRHSQEIADGYVGNVESSNLSVISFLSTEL